ncbi:Abhydrolase-4 domain-containing protein [Mycena chlorophos]|uniref:Abhydrolase-4 domain-containing protein n=1 Tax=Mycena chlorophos TaxID=658473 RepID=A0A8H6SUS4_MYCCL|nr:Abhydrolase-4 domain-containing protein [Mycena chlorophos]
MGALPLRAAERRRGYGAVLVALALFGLVWRHWCLRDVISLSKEPAIDWKPCWQDPEFLCGVLDVPTDHDDPSAGTIPIYLTKLPATKPERLGIVFTHPGGPGGSGVDASFVSARSIRNATGGHHDIISFDQRGQGRARPNVNCFGSARAYYDFHSNTVFQTTFSVPRDPFSDAGRAVLVEQQRQALALEETQGAVCARTVGKEALGYMSTTATVYDIEEISRVLEGEDALINFYSGSYGTVLGQYLVNMLPHKTGRVYISGNVPADMWANVHYETQELLRLLLADAEKTYTFFLNECFEAGPKHCALSRQTDTNAQSIKDRIDAFIDRLQEQPLAVANSTRPGYITSGAVRLTLFLAIQMPDYLPRFFTYIARAMDGDGAELLRFVKRAYPPSDPETGPDEDGYVYIAQENLSRLAISCGDALPRTEEEQPPTAEEIVDATLGTVRDVSPRFGATAHMIEQHGGCHYWPGTGVGPARYRGPWNNTLATRILVASNLYDPITPISAGTLVQHTMGPANAHHLIQDAAGHSTNAPNTQCAAQVIRRYFVEGVLPEGSETRCAREQGNYFVHVVRERGVGAQLLGQEILRNDRLLLPLAS